MPPKKKPGRQPLVSHETVLNTMLLFDIFDEQNKLKKKRDPVWKQICNAFNDTRPKAAVSLFLAVKQNRNNLKSNYKEMRNITEYDNKTPLNNNSTDDKL